jgi:hypothetical protein
LRGSTSDYGGSDPLIPNACFDGADPGKGENTGSGFALRHVLAGLF